MSKKPTDGPRKAAGNPKGTSRNPNPSVKDPNFTENRGNTLNVNGPIKVTEKPATNPAMPPNKSSNKAEGGK